MEESSHPLMVDPTIRSQIRSHSPVEWRMAGGEGAWVVAVDCGISALRIPSTNTRGHQSPGVLVQNADSEPPPRGLGFSGSGVPARHLPFFFFFFIDLFIWLPRVLVAARGIFVAACGIFS